MYVTFRAHGISYRIAYDQLLRSRFPQSRDTWSMSLPLSYSVIKGGMRGLALTITTWHVCLFFNLSNYPAASDWLRD